MSRKRLFTIFVVLALAILAAAGSWIAGSKIQSPAEAAARTAPPVASPILVPVEERVLSSDIVTRGTARYGLPQTLSIAPSALKSGPGVIATLPLRNAPLAEGDVMLTASGRPVFVLQGKVPAYRDLTPGLSGEDVRQFEEALNRLGFDPGPVDGVYDEQTSAAVADWYAAAGFAPFGPTPDQRARIRTLENDLAVATEDKLAAVDDAAAAPLAVSAARSSAENANQAAAADLAAKTIVRDKIVTDPTSSSEDRTKAEADLAVARAAVTSTQLAGEVAIQAAIDAQHDAERKAKRLTDAADRIAQDLDLARRNTGVQVPVDELVFVPTLPVRVEDLNVLLGDAANGPVLAVTDNQLAIDSSLPLDEAPLVKPGMAVAIDEPDLGIKATGVVKRVADAPGTNGVDGYHIYMEILVDKTETSLVGTSLRLTIPIKSTGGKVLAVPVSAISLAVDGTSRVQVSGQTGLNFIVVEPGLSAGGYVEVKPVDGTLSPGDLVVIGFEQK